MGGAERERAGGRAERNMQRGRPQRGHSVGETPATVLRYHYPPLSAVLSFKGRTDGERKNSRRLEAKGRRHRSTARMEGERRSACICVRATARETDLPRWSSCSPRCSIPPPHSPPPSAPPRRRRIPPPRPFRSSGRAAPSPSAPKCAGTRSRGRCLAA